MLSFGFALDLVRHSAGRFAEVMRRVSGDGVCPWGGEFGLGLDGMRVTLQSGFALAGGYWLMCDEPETLTVPPASNTGDRVDGIAVYVSFPDRRADLRVVEDIGGEDLSGGILEREEGFALLLYTVRVRRGATSLREENITDRRRAVPSLSALSKEGLRTYEFLKTGLDARVEAILAQSRAEAERADEAAASLDRQISQSGKGPGVGELMLSMAHPVPAAQWLLCDGSAIAPEYLELRGLLGGHLPRVSPEDPRLSAYIYAGQPLSPGEMHARYVPQGSDGYMTEDSKIYCVMR